MRARLEDDPLARLRTELDGFRASCGEKGETSLDTGLEYRPGEPVLVVARRRGRRWDFGDAGRAVELSGSPPGWLEAAGSVVAEEGMNVNRAGVVFAPAVERPGRDLAALALRIGETSRAVFAELLELE
ncbi:MAG TPA: hypothetical protein VD704_03265 [Gaiellaceae bacterium]|nr:hypothetical protein [Gaiellaceae bacterium]